SCPPFYPPSLLLIVHLLAKHVQSNSFFAAQSSSLIFDFLLCSQAHSRLSSYPPSSLSPILYIYEILFAPLIFIVTITTYIIVFKLTFHLRLVHLLDQQNFIH